MKKLKVLVGCEESGEVRRAFRELGHDAVSCDLLPPSDGELAQHVTGDVLELLRGHWLDYWDLGIFFPPCTNLCVSGARWFKQKRESGEQQKSVEFFLRLAGCGIEHVAIENPIGIMSSLYGKPDQIIQPWQFGHGETKATCLWLKNLPKLIPTDIVSGREARIHKMAPGPERSKERSKTYSGIARAMAAQWSAYLTQS